MFSSSIKRLLVAPAAAVALVVTGGVTSSAQAAEAGFRCKDGSLASVTANWQLHNKSGHDGLRYRDYWSGSHNLNCWNVRFKDGGRGDFFVVVTTKNTRTDKKTVRSQNFNHVRRIGDIVKSGNYIIRDVETWGDMDEDGVFESYQKHRLSK